jgi:hypothetical protein
MIGKKFDRLVVLALSHRNAQGRIFWRCRCDCGNEAVVSGTNLRRGTTRSCNCLRAEVERGTHGLSHTPEYASWIQMLHRCNNPERTKYEYYGGSGITVCRRWLQFENFLADMGARPTPTHTLERKNNKRNYTPGNCRWATRKEQAQNRRNSVLLTYKGKTQTVAAWAEQLGKSYGTIYTRHKVGWPVERILQGAR